MNNLNRWAIKYNIPLNALNELLIMFGVVNTNCTAIPAVDRSEASVLNMVRLEASQKGIRLWRNNVGAITTDDGRHIRFGLCNDSKQMNSMVKSSDLIGIRKRLIIENDVGKYIAQFVAREVKRSDWQYTATPREQSQLRFIELVNSYGGDARFTTTEGTL